MTNFDYFDEQLFDIAHKIARHGFTTMAVGSGQCSVSGCDCPPNAAPTWAYSIGMLEHNHPEVVIVGETPERAYHLIDLAYQRHHLGLSLPFGRDDRTTALDATITTVPVPDRCWTESDLMAFWHNYYRTIGWPPIDGFAVPVVQLVVADAAGRFPWDEECDDDLRASQPIIQDDDSVWPRWNRASRRARQRSNRRRGR